jgi:hypothetical protein
MRVDGDNLYYLFLDGRIIFSWICMKWDVGDTDCIEMAQDREMWRALVTAVMNLRVL